MRKKKMIQKCVLASIICTIMFLFPFLVKDLDEDSSFSYSKMDVTCIVNKDGSINLYNLTKIKEINIHAQLMWYY